MIRTCNKCGTVAFSVSRKHAEEEFKRFNAYFDTLTKEQQQEYYGGKKSGIHHYDRCWCGNSYTNFRDSKPGDCPNGCTLSPIIREPDEES